MLDPKSITSWHAHVYFDASSRDAAWDLRETINKEINDLVMPPLDREDEPSGQLVVMDESDLLVPDDVASVVGTEAKEVSPPEPSYLTFKASPRRQRILLPMRTLDRFEQEHEDFHRRVADGFRAMATADPDRWVVVDGTRSPDDVASLIRTAVRDRLGV